MNPETDVDQILLDVRQKPLNSFCRSLLRYDILEDSSLCFLLFQCYQPVVPIRRVVVVLVVESPQIYANEHGQGSCDCRFLRTVMVAGYVMGAGVSSSIHRLFFRPEMTGQ